MQGKSLAFAHVLDLRALRVIVADVPACYAVLGRVHELFRVVPDEFDDYIARPKPNGYQSLHSVVLDGEGRPVEVQIRTRAMHEHAEHGVAAHWAYKEAGAKGYAGVSASGDFDAKVAEARKAVLRQLLAWERDFVEQGGPAGGAGAGLFDDRIYVFTPAAEIVELPAGATPIDFAYVVHTSLGHRCRGAKVDGAMVPLNTALKSGQTVEVTALKEGGPSLDWLNAELGYLQSPRSKAKVRAWFNALALQDTIARGREAVEKLLQRVGKTAVKLDDLASQLGFRNADALFEVVGKDEFSLRNIESLLRPRRAATHTRRDHRAAPVAARHRRAQGGCAGGRRRVVDDESGALLPARTAGCDQRLRHARQGCGDPPRRMQQLPRDGRACARACHRGGLGPAARRQGKRLSRRRDRRSRRPARPAARHLRSVREGKHERD